MKIIKSKSNLRIKMSKKEWERIGLMSNWLRKADNNIDVTRQISDTNKLYEAMKKMRNDMSTLQNSADTNTTNAMKDAILSTLNEVIQGNLVVKLDAEIGLNVESLRTALENNDLIMFNQILEKKFKSDLDESKAQLDRQLAKQQGAQQGVDMSLTEGGNL